MGKVRGIVPIRWAESLMKNRSVHNIHIERLWVEVKWIIVTKWMLRLPSLALVSTQ